MKEVKLSRKEFRERFGDTKACTGGRTGPEPTIYIPGRASSNVRLHEIYHATRSPQLEEIKEKYTPEEVISEEVRAEQFTSESKGWGGIKINKVGGIAEYFLYQGYKPNKVFRSVVEALEDEGYMVDDELKGTLWSFIKERYKVKKSRG